MYIYKKEKRKEKGKERREGRKKCNVLHEFQMQISWQSLHKKVNKNKEEIDQQQISLIRNHT